jgi:hypothetical protein
MEIENGSLEIRKCIQRAFDTNDGAIIGRNGTIELEQMISMDPRKNTILEKNAGIFGAFSEWRNESIEATRNADILATGWYEPLKEVEQVALKNWNSSAIQIPLRSLEPYYISRERWTELLSGHGISVVSCFTETMKSQMSKEIWKSPVIPVGCTWNWVQTGHPPSVAKGINEWPSHIRNSMDAIEYVVSEVIRHGSRFALIGCGGIGMPIALRLKQRGVIAIVLGGAIQVFFGIKGKRWETHSIISGFWNEAWVYPSQEETPGLAKTIEGGCYW